MNHESIDLTLVKCPLTLLRAVEALAPLGVGERLDILVKGAEPLRDMTTSLTKEGHKVVKIIAEEDQVHRLRVERGVVID